MQNKKAAMEMSVGTIVTIVLLMSVLVLGIFLIKNIFESGANAIEGVDAQIQAEINEIFNSGEKSLIIYPNSREIKIKRGDDSKGFAFSIKNEDGLNPQVYTYNVSAYSTENCGSAMTPEQANKKIIGASGRLEIQRGGTLENARMVKFNFDKSDPACTIVYELVIRGDQGQVKSTDIWMIVK